MKLLPIITALTFVFAAGSELSAQATSKTTETLPALEETIEMAPFVVNAQANEGYRSSNSISGTRLLQRLEDIPQNISVITEDFIKDIQARDLAEALSYTAGVTRDDVTSESSFSLRGFNALRPLRNGVTTSGGVIADPVSISRIEVVKGPAAVLYGATSPGGVINYVTKEPGEKRAVVLKETAASFSDLRSEADVNLPLVRNGKKGLFLRLLGAYEDNGAFIGNGFVRRFYSAGLLWRPTEKTDILITLERSRQNQERVGTSVMNFAQTAFLDLPTKFNEAGTLDTDLTFLQAQIRQGLGAHWNARVAFTFHENKQYYAFFTPSGSRAVDATNTSVRYALSNNTNRFPNYDLTAEAVGKYRFGDVETTTLIGGEYLYNILHYRAANAPSTASQTWIIANPATWTFGRLADPTVYTSINTNSSDRYQAFRGAYIDQQVSLFHDKIRASAGLRSDGYTIDYTYVARTGASRYATLSKNRISPKVGMIYRPLPGLSLFALYSESFIQNALYDINGNPLAPQTGKGWEAGVKGSLFKGRLSGTISAYKILRQNVPLAIPGVSPTAYTLIGEQEADGVEGQVFYSPTDPLQFIASYAYNDAYRTQDTNPALVGSPLANAPKNMASLWVKLAPKQGALKGFSLGMGVRYKSDFLAFDPSTSSINVPSSRYYDALVGYGRRTGTVWWSVNLKVTNLFDEDGGQLRGIPVAPRAYSLATEVKF